MSVRSISLRWVLLAWIAVTALIALNRGIDLLWGVTLLLIVATLVAALLPKFQVQGVRVCRVNFPTTATVGRPESIAYEIQAPAGRARYGLEIVDRLNGESAALPTAYVPRAKGTCTYSFTWTPQTRGCWQLRELAIESSYPLALTRARRVIEADAHAITVYPDFVPLHWLPVRNEAHPRFEQAVSARRGGHDEFFGLKPYVPGDERRAVHWRSAARLGELIVKEYEQQQDRELWILLDLAEAGHIGDGLGSTCEDMIRIAHSIAVKARSEDIPVGIVYRVADAVAYIKSSTERAAYLQIRDALARINKHPQLPLVKWGSRFRERLPHGGTWIVFNLGGVDDRITLEQLARERSAVPVFVEFDKSSYVDEVPREARVWTHMSSRSIVTTVARGANLAELFKP
jgi:uncharacterized protein (DUF58 family)